MAIVAPTSSRLLVKRDGSSITRRIPKPTVLVDTREQLPFNFSEHKNWIAGTLWHKLEAGDYSVQGMENLISLERKSLTDLISTLMYHRVTFFKSCERLTQYRWRALLVEASYEDVKSLYGEELFAFAHESRAHPNAVSGSLDAVEAKFNIPVIYTSRYRPLAEEKAASWLSKHFTYWYLEENGLGRVLQDGDL